MNYAGFWRRFAAAFIDGLIVGVVSGIVGALLVAIANGNSGQVSIFSNLLGLLIGIGYYVYYQSKVGQTLGKKAMGVKVVDAQGKTPSMGTFFLREIIGKFVSALILGIGYLMMLWDPRKQTLHDKIASTFVIKV